MYSAGVTTLLKNRKEDFDKASSVLIRVSSNIIKNNAVEKYRSIRIDSQVFQTKILPFDGAVQCLLDMGFQENGEKFTLPFGNNLDDVENIHHQLLQASETINAVATSNHLVHSQRKILAKLQSHFQHCKIYENKSLQKKAHAAIPVLQLNKQAQKRHASANASHAKDKPSFHYYLILELLAWFKRDFFTWTDAPKCLHCNSSDKPTVIGMLSPTQEDLAWGAARVEGYQCPNCLRQIRFPRYNHPEKLLESRTGRCGEWANCFTLLCRAMGFEARHVVDWTDHVWTEVRIPQWDRWIHCDPCENACDQPLMYEKGWKKKVSLIVAASAEEIVDVTWRYSVDRGEVLRRRNEMFGADWLVSSLNILNTTQANSVTQERAVELERRRLAERVEFEEKQYSNDENYEGRTSGSLAWRLARKETDGHESRISKDKAMNVSIEATNIELENGCIEIEYCCKSDQYIRKSNNDEKVSGWDTMVYKYCDIQRKEEFDWKQVYLCRVEESDLGHMMWNFLIPQKYEISKIIIQIISTTFESGSVAWLLASNSACDIITPGKVEAFGEKYHHSRSLSIHAVLRGGQGENAWQKAQLFRVPTDSETTTSPFAVLIGFKKISAGGLKKSC